MKEPLTLAVPCGSGRYIDTGFHTRLLFFAAAGAS